MIENGQFAEAKSLHQHKSLRSLQTVGYQELFAHFDGELDLETAISEIQKNSRRYAKRQITWFKKYEAFKAHPDQKAEILAHIRSRTS